MADNLLNTIDRVSSAEFLPLFSRKFYEEWERTNRFSMYIDTSMDMPICIKNEPKEGGESIKFNFLRSHDGAGVGGNMRLVDRESTLLRDQMTIKVEFMREAFATKKGDEKKSIAQIMPHLKPELSKWSKVMIRNRIIDGFYNTSPDVCLFTPMYNPDPARVQPGDPAAVVITTQSSAAQSTKWLTDNRDRVLFGLADANFNTNFATAMAATSAATDGLSVKLIQKAHDYFKNADVHMKPLSIGAFDEEKLVAFTDTTSFRQLQADPAMLAANQYARAREGDGWKKNPIATGADLEYDGVIIREIPEMKPVVLDGGVYRPMRASDSAAIKATARGRVVFCGAGAVAIAVGQEPQFHEEVNDYNFRKGVAIEEMYGVNKMQRQGIQDPSIYIDHGMVTCFTNATA